MTKLKSEIETLLHENASDFEIAKVLKQDIKAYFSTLGESFSTSGGKDFLVKHTKKIDNLLKLVYKIASRDMFGHYLPMKNNIPITLVALGSYGREQLCVYSDIDLMIVYKDLPGYQTQNMIEKILYILWDTGIKLGHRVHEVEELFEVSRTDITIKTALIESRMIEGSSFLWTETQNILTRIRYDNPEKFIAQKLEEQRQKHQKFPLTMEPNLKEGVGGFRDANLIFWIGKVRFNAHNIKTLPLDIITHQDYRHFRRALEFLFRVRSALHLATGKKEDTLHLDLIPDVAHYLGYKNTQEAHTKFVKKVTGALKTLRLYSTIWLEALSRDMIVSSPQENYLYPQHTIEDINTLLKQLIKRASTPFLPHPTFLQKLIHAQKPSTLNPKLYSTIKTIFYQKHAHDILNTLSYAKLLKYIIPPIYKVVDMPQFDGYHQYAVDIHSLKCLEHLETMQDAFLLSRFNALNKEEKMLLKILVFLHDAGKGRHTDHHLVGVSLFKSFAHHLGLENRLIKMGETLILYHTLMSNVAQREDLHNEKVILKFASHFPNKTLLDLIYLLTYADMSGVGEGIYNSFTAQLIHTLYQESIASLKHEKILTETTKRLKQESALKKYPPFLALKKSQQKKILNIHSNLLFIKYSSQEILKISQTAFDTQDHHLWIAQNGHLKIEIIRKGSLNLGYLLAKLSHLHLIQMDIAALFEGYKYFKMEFDTQCNDDDDIFRIKQSIKESFEITQHSILKKPEIKPKEIRIDIEHSKNFIALYLNTPDQKGLLAFVVDIFNALNLHIASAKIHTIKNRTRDIFLIEKSEKFSNDDVETILQKLTASK